MAKQYTDDEITLLASDYERHGAVRLPGFIEAGWVDKVRDLIDREVEKVDQARQSEQISSFLRSEGRLTIRYLWRENALLREFLFRDDIARTIARIVGSRTLRFWFDLTFIHFGEASGAPGFGTPWHHDVPTFSFKGDLMPSLWMALTPTTADLSRLMFIDGSHKNTQGYYRSPEIRKPENGEKDGFLDLPDFDAMIERGEVRVISWNCEPGDGILLHPSTIHGARGISNTGCQSRRMAMTTRWLGDDVRFLPHSYVQSRKQRAIIETDLMFGQRPHGEWFPLVYDAEGPGNS